MASATYFTRRGMSARVRYSGFCSVEPSSPGDAIDRTYVAYKTVAQDVVVAAIAVRIPLDLLPPPGVPKWTICKEWLKVRT